MVYLLGGNYCAIRFLAGDIPYAQSRWHELTAVAMASNYTDRDFLVLRHELLSEIIDSGELLSPASFDTCLIERYPDRLGPLWNNFGHGLMLPALELWREN